MYFLAGTLTNETLADMKDVPLYAHLTIEVDDDDEDNMIIEECDWEDYADNEDQEAATMHLVISGTPSFQTMPLTCQRKGTFLGGSQNIHQTCRVLLSTMN